MVEHSVAPNDGRASVRESSGRDFDRPSRYGQTGLARSGMGEPRRMRRRDLGETLVRALCEPRSLARDGTWVASMSPRITA